MFREGGHSSVRSVQIQKELGPGQGWSSAAWSRLKHSGPVWAKNNGVLPQTSS